MLHRLVVLNSELSPGVSGAGGPPLSFNKAGFGVDERDH